MDASQPVTYRANIVSTPDRTTKLRWPHNFGSYRLADRALASGSLLGSPFLQMRLKATGAIERVYCVAAGRSPIGTFSLRHWDEASGMKLDLISGHYFLFPEHQEHKYMLSNGVYAREDVFVAGSIVHYIVEYANDSEERQRMATYAFCDLATEIDDALEVEYDSTLGALVARSKDEPVLARIVGADRKALSYELSGDRAMAVTGDLPGMLSNRTDSPRGISLGVLHYSTALEPGERGAIAFRLCVSAGGVDDARKTYRMEPAAEPALRKTQEHYHTMLSRSVALTPNPEINRGVLWAKANMERVMLETPDGPAFTNDPMNSTNCVGRDAAWFCAGADYFRPDFSGDCLAQFFERQERSGLLVEYFDMLTGRTEDFGLNVNDDTPLLIWSAWHHYQATGDPAFLERHYANLLKAGRYLAAQRNEKGLVWCNSRGTGSRGIAGWRNVIPNYRLSGAVTEINSEAYGAFRALAALANATGDSRAGSEFSELAGDLRTAVNTHLVNPRNGLYYLNIDVDGTPRSDITADMVLPLLFGIADREMTLRVLRRLSDRDFWTPGGMRTIPYDAMDYDPEGASGCLGGVWNGVTFWYANAAAPYLPNFAEEALTVGFENYARDPQRNNTVPGQFSEWLHGETLVNQGMELSPWFPPRYVWATVEGLLGFDISPPRARISPRIPSDWTWCGLQNVPYRGNYVTWFAACTPEMRVWCTQDLDAACPVSVLGEDISDRTHASGDDARAVGLRAGNTIAVLAGNTVDRTVTTALRIRELHGEFSMREYESLQRTWNRRRMTAVELERGFTVDLAPKGFRLFELAPL